MAIKYDEHGFPYEDAPGEREEGDNQGDKIHYLSETQGFGEADWRKLRDRFEGQERPAAKPRNPDAMSNLITWGCGVVVVFLILVAMYGLFTE